MSKTLERLGERPVLVLGAGAAVVIALGYTLSARKSSSREPHVRVCLHSNAHAHTLHLAICRSQPLDPQTTPPQRPTWMVASSIGSLKAISRYAISLAVNVDTDALITPRPLALTPTLALPSSATCPSVPRTHIPRAPVRRVVRHGLGGTSICITRFNILPSADRRSVCNCNFAPHLTFLRTFDARILFKILLSRSNRAS